MSRKKTDFYELTKRTTFLNVAALSFVCLLGIVYTLYYSNVGKILFHILSVCVRGAVSRERFMGIFSSFSSHMCFKSSLEGGEKERAPIK